MQTYYVHESFTRDRARIHRAECHCCNFGRGFMTKTSGLSGCWHGPFPARAAAYAFTAGLSRKEKAACARCRP